MGVLNNILGGIGGGNLLNMALGVAGMAFPPLGIGLSLMNMFAPVLGQALQGGLQQLCQQGGMPKFVADMVGELLQQVVQQFQQQCQGQEGWNPECDQHMQQQGAGGDMQDFANDFNKSFVDNALHCIGDKKHKGASSWLEALAQALGQSLDQQAQKIQDLSSQITDQNAKDKPSTMTELQTASQRMSFMMSAADQIIKTLGEALGTMARKQ